MRNKLTGARDAERNGCSKWTPNYILYSATRGRKVNSSDTALVRYILRSFTQRSLYYVRIDIFIILYCIYYVPACVLARILRNARFFFFFMIFILIATYPYVLCIRIYYMVSGIHFQSLPDGRPGE